MLCWGLQTAKVRITLMLAWARSREKNKKQLNAPTPHGEPIMIMNNNNNKLILEGCKSDKLSIIIIIINIRRLVTLAEHTSDHGMQTNSNINVRPLLRPQAGDRHRQPAAACRLHPGAPKACRPTPLHVEGWGHARPQRPRARLQLDLLRDWPKLALDRELWRGVASRC